MSVQTLSSLAALFGTPLYAFELDALEARARFVRAALGRSVRLCFCVKANPFITDSLSPALFPQLEVCSPGELALCRAVDVAPSRILFSGVNKTAQDVRAAFDAGVKTMTTESPLQLRLINEEALRRHACPDVLLRLSAGDQFGMAEETLRAEVQNRDAYAGVRMTGLHFFSGTQKKLPAKIEAELAYLTEFCGALRRESGFACTRLEYGPGLFADYFGDPAQSEPALLFAVAPALKKAAEAFELTVEMGRFFAAPCGTYLTTVMDVKRTQGVNYAILDGGVHQLQYDGQLFGMKQPRVTLLGAPRHDAPTPWTLCGSLCTTRDVLAKGVALPPLAPGDRLAFHHAGAYGVYEGPALFLSRDLPAVALYHAQGVRLVRAAQPTHVLNTPDKG